MPTGVAFLQNLPARSEFIKPLTARTFSEDATLRWRFRHAPGGARANRRLAGLGKV